MSHFGSQDWEEIGKSFSFLTTIIIVGGVFYFWISLLFSLSVSLLLNNNWSVSYFSWRLSRSIVYCCCWCCCHLTFWSRSNITDPFDIRTISHDGAIEVWCVVHFYSFCSRKTVDLRFNCFLIWKNFIIETSHDFSKQSIDCPNEYTNSFLDRLESEFSIRVVWNKKKVPPASNASDEMKKLRRVEKKLISLIVLVEFLLSKLSSPNEGN